MSKQVLFIGSACVDVVIYLDHLPKTAEDLHPHRQELVLGGCACNAAVAALNAKADAVLAAPVGTGAYGEFVERELNKRGIPIRIRSERENGCCYCFVEKGGERTFLSLHGAEYVFDRSKMEEIDREDYCYVYVCGLEVEEPTGEALIGYLADHPERTIFYAPGTRGIALKEKNERMFALHPILHLNEEEALRLVYGDAWQMQRKADQHVAIREALETIYEKTRNSVIVTMGADGAYCLDPWQIGGGPEFTYVNAPKVETVVNTNGAGDTHAGTVLAVLAKGRPLREAVERANEAAAAFVQRNV